MTNSYISTRDSITFVHAAESYTVARSNKQYAAVVACIQADDWAGAVAASGLGKIIASQGQGKITVHNGQVYYNGNVIHNTLSERIVDMVSEGFDVANMIAFMQNLMQNPSSTAIQELYDFLAVGNLPITSDGHFLAYKKVRENYLDIYSGTHDNHVGCTVSMPRSQVDDNRSNTCSTGLHFCSLEYLKNFGRSATDRVMIIKINPRDVVSIPADYNNTKGRCSEYTVVDEHAGNRGHAAFDSTVVEKYDIQEAETVNKALVIADATFKPWWPSYIRKIMNSTGGNIQGDYKIVHAVKERYRKNGKQLSTGDWILTLRYDDGHEERVSLSEYIK